MKKPCINLVIAFVTFSVGIGLTLGLRSYIAPKSTYDMVMSMKVYSNSSAIDKKLAETLLALQNENLEKDMQRTGYIEKGCQLKGLDAADCAVYREGFKAARQEAIINQVRLDVGNANRGCMDDKLSEAACTARKEVAIRDIQDNMLTK